MLAIGSLLICCNFCTYLFGQIVSPLYGTLLYNILSTQLCNVDLIYNGTLLHNILNMQLCNIDFIFYGVDSIRLFLMLVLLRRTSLLTTIYGLYFIQCYTLHITKFLLDFLKAASMYSFNSCHDSIRLFMLQYYSRYLSVLICGRTIKSC